MAGLLMGGIGTIFYVILLLGMGVAKLWHWGLGWIQRIGHRRVVCHSIGRRPRPKLYIPGLTATEPSQYNANADKSTL